MIKSFSQFFSKDRFSKAEIKSYFTPRVNNNILNNLLNSKDFDINSYHNTKVAVAYIHLNQLTNYNHHFKAPPLAEMFTIFIDTLQNKIKEFDGVIDQIIGTSLNCFWAETISGIDVEKKAMKCTFELSKTVDQINKEMKKLGYPPVQVNLGLDSGNGTIGNFTAGNYLHYSIISEVTEVATKLQKLNDSLGTMVLCTEQLLAGSKESIPNTRYMGSHILRANKLKTEIFELMENENMEAFDRKSLIKHFESGMRAFEDEELSFATACFKKAIRVWPKDEASTVMLSKINDRLEKGF